MDLFAAPTTLADRRADGSLVLESALAPVPPAASMAHLFRDAAAARPGRLLVADRDRGASGRPVMILSGTAAPSTSTMGGPARRP
ncbi:hypothetical protein [Actinomadura geliboluensis]|uniref:hypothetical protein n=1 Tax=Actinomadura geliboluensis TaxID=882440 RepID=UPI0036A3F3EC